MVRLFLRSTRLYIYQVYKHLFLFHHWYYVAFIFDLFGLGSLVFTPINQSISTPCQNIGLMLLQSLKRRHSISDDEPNFSDAAKKLSRCFAQVFCFFEFVSLKKTLKKKEEDKNNKCYIYIYVITGIVCRLWGKKTHVILFTLGKCSGLHTASHFKKHI